MGQADAYWRDQLLQRAQTRFERYLDATLRDINRIETRIQRRLTSVRGPDATMRRQMIRAEVKQLAGIRRKTQALRSAARGNLKRQLSGAGTWDVAALGARRAARKR